MKISVSPYFALHLLEQVEDLRLHGDVERGDRLVADDQLRLGGHGAGDRDALALAAGELVRSLRAGDRRVDADGVEHLVDPRGARRLVADLPDVEALAHDVAHAPARVQRRDRVLEDHLQLRPQRAEAARPGAWVSSLPSNRTEPLFAWTSCITALPIVDLPQPDSPTSPRVSPGSTSMLTFGHRVDLEAGAPDRELDDEVLDAQQRLRRRGGGGRCRCRPSDGRHGDRGFQTGLHVGLERGPALGRADRDPAAERVAVVGRRR